MKNKRVLAIIEELGDLSTSGAIVNYNLCKILSKQVQNVDILTLDSISDKYLNEYIGGKIYLHPKNNLSKFQIWIEKNLLTKLYAVIRMFLGNDLSHYNRVKNIQKFLKNNQENYDVILFLSAGLGFTPHHALTKKISKKTIGVYHDPYPISCYPDVFKSGKKWPEYFKIKNQQTGFDNIDYLIFPSQRLYEWYLNDYKIDIAKVHIIPHAVNFETTDIILINNEINIVHAGTLLKPRNPKTFISAFKNLGLDKKLKLYFYGGINDIVMNDIYPLIENTNIEIHNNRITYEDALVKLKNSSFQLLIESDAKDNPFLPTKFVDYINIGKPIIALTPKSSEIARLLGENYPFLCDLNDEKAISEILKNKIFDQTFINLAQEKINTLQKYFSEEYIMKMYNEIIA